MPLYCMRVVATAIHSAIRIRCLLQTILALALLHAVSTRAAFTEFYMIAGVGANTNSGSTADAAPVYSSVNGTWDGTSFVPSDGSIPADSITSGMWLSLYPDRASAALVIARVTAVKSGVNGRVTLSATVGGMRPARNLSGD
jgi:hypothetical protein